MCPTRFFLAGVVGFFWGIAAFGVAGAPTAGPATASRPATSLADKAPVAYQMTLLDLAMETASAIPLEPHIKDRCRAQQDVVEACLAANAYESAVKYTEQVKDWRRGACYADLAVVRAKRGDAAESRKYLEKADSISNAVGLEAWRRDAIRVKMAEAQTLLGDHSEAEKTTAGLSAADGAKIVGLRNSQDETAYEKQFRILAALAGSKDQQTVNGSLLGVEALYDRYYDKKDRRTTLEKLIHDGWDPLPIFQRIEVQLKLCESALGHGDQAHGLELITAAEAIKAGAKWPIEYETPLTAHLAEYRYRAGDQSKASADLGAALKKYESNKKEMLDIEYVGALLPVAEAYVAIGDRNSALSVYKRATEESTINPNSRPRALDLAAICRSMALHGFEPDAALWERLRQIRKGLSDPW